jgi:predicted kinase
MPTLFLICGLPGSGKTTLAKQLEYEHSALRLTPDEWMARIVGDGYDEAKRAEVEAIQWEVAARVLHLGVSVVLDWGFWSKAERDDFRSRATKLGIKTKLLFLNVSPDELLRRLAVRNATLPADTFGIDKAQLTLWSSWFEPPKPEELD